MARTPIMGWHYIVAGSTYRVVSEPQDTPMVVLVENGAGQRHWVERALVEKVAEPR